MEADATALRAVAENVARRYGHAAVSKEHVVLALAEDGVTLHALSEMRLHEDTLVTSLRARLEKAQAAGGYRGNRLRCFDVEALIDEHTRTTGFRRTPLLNVKDLLAAVLKAPDLRDVLESARFDADPVRRFIGEAASIARDHAHRNVLAEHALIAACGLPQFRTAVLAGGIDVDELGRALRRVFRERGFRSAKLGSADAIVTKACEHANVVGSRELSVAPAIVELLRNPYLVRSLATQGFDAWTILFALVHRTREDGDGGMTAKEVGIVVHDDPFTTMDHVIGVLESVFGASAADAEAAMWTIHREGSAVIGVYPLAAARRLLARAKEASRVHGMPLRVILRPVDGPLPREMG